MAGRHARPTRAQVRARRSTFAQQPVSDRVRTIRRHRAVRRAKQASTGAAGLAGAILVGVVAGGGTYALWNDTSILDAGTIHTGTAALGLSSAHVDALNMLPGEIRGTVVELSNTGDADLDVTALLDAVSDRFEVRTAIGHAGCGTDPIGGGTLNDVSTTGLGSLSAGATVELCVEVTALAALVPDDEFDFDVTLEGTTDS